MIVTLIDRILILRLLYFPGKGLTFLETFDGLLVDSILHEGYLFVFLQVLEWLGTHYFILTLDNHGVLVNACASLCVSDFWPEKPSCRSLLTFRSQFQISVHQGALRLIYENFFAILPSETVRFLKLDKAAQ